MKKDAEERALARERWMTEMKERERVGRPRVRQRVVVQLGRAHLCIASTPHDRYQRNASDALDEQNHDCVRETDGGQISVRIRETRAERQPRARRTRTANRDSGHREE